MHTPAPEQPPDSTCPGHAEASSSIPEGSGVPDSMPGQSAAPDDDLTASAVSEPGDDTAESAPSSKKADSPGPRQSHDEGSRGPDRSLDPDLDCTNAGQECTAGDLDIPDEQLATDAHEATPDVGVAARGVTDNRDEGRSARPARMPLAALQEAGAPMLASLSFKQAVHAKQSLGEL